MNDGTQEELLGSDIKTADNLDAACELLTGKVEQVETLVRALRAENADLRQRYNTLRQNADIARERLENLAGRCAMPGYQASDVLADDVSAQTLELTSRPAADFA